MDGSNPPEVDVYISKNVPWGKLSTKSKEIFGNSQKAYEKAVVNYSIRNQLRFADNLVRQVHKDQRKYYSDLVTYSKEALMLFPYHLSDLIVRGLRITPFQYYLSMLEKIMEQEKNYDSLPNFTAADCLRLLGIGRNQYIELMNQIRSNRKIFRKKSPKEFLPVRPVSVTIEPWFVIQYGYITDDDINSVKPDEKKLIDHLIDNGGQKAGTLNYDQVHSLYRKGLVYVDVPIFDDDFIVVPPLEGFVMNRVLGDYLENILYKLFVSIDEHTTVRELSSVLDIDVDLIKSAVSLYCRLGFAYKKTVGIDWGQCDESWKAHQEEFMNKNRNFFIAPDESSLTEELSSAISYDADFLELSEKPGTGGNSGSEKSPGGSRMTSEAQPDVASIQHSPATSSKRIAFLYDSTITAFLMMGNLSPGLKNHAVTMFEVGKMTDESLDCFLGELELVSSVDSEGEGEAQRYFEHAKTLRKTILFLRNNSNLGSVAIDLLRCESLLNLDKVTCSRLLNKNYRLLVSMAPLSHEVTPICCDTLPHFGPPAPQLNSVWFKLFLYSLTNGGPTSLLLCKGSMLKELPNKLSNYERYLVTSFGHDSVVIPGANALLTLNETLCHSSVFVQAYGLHGEASTVVVPFPFLSRKSANKADGNLNIYTKWAKHPAILKLSRVLNLQTNCGYITMINLKGSGLKAGSDSYSKDSNTTDGSRVTSQEQFSGNTLSQLVELDEAMQSNGNEKVAPGNGFNDAVCAEIYKEEIEQCLSNIDATLQPKPQPFDRRLQSIESLRLDLNSSSQASSDAKNNDVSGNSSWFDDWTILDCHFGIPLFDSVANEIICETLSTNGLWEMSSLESLIHSNLELKTRLESFIQTYQASNVWESEIPLPSQNYYCHNGRIQEFET